MQSMPAATRSGSASVPNVCAVTRAPFVGRRDRRLQSVGRPCGAEVAQAAVDPVADELHPAVAAAGLGTHLRREVGRLDLDREAGDVAARGGDVPAGPMIRGRSGSSSSARVSTGEPQSRSASTPAARSVSAWSRAAARSATGPPPRAMPTWQWAIHQPGDQPATAGDRLRPGHRLEREPPVPDPDVAVLALREDDPREVQGRHRPGRSSPGASKRSLERSGSCCPGGSPGTPPAKPPPGKPPPGSPPGGSAGAPMAAARGRPWPCPCPSCPSSPGPASGGRGPSSTSAPCPAGPCCRPSGSSSSGPGEPLQQLVDVGDADAGAVGDPHPPRGVDDLRRDALVGVIDRMIAAVRSRSRSSMFLICSFIAPAPGSMPSRLARGPSCGWPSSARGSPRG